MGLPKEELKNRTYAGDKAILKEEKVGRGQGIAFFRTRNWNDLLSSFGNFDKRIDRKGNHIQLPEYALAPRRAL
jgi:hypothetical protein